MFNLNRKKKISGGLPSGGAGRSLNESSTKNNSGFGSGGLNGKSNGGGSEGSSSASRFYDTGADNSSISDNLFPDHHNSNNLNGIGSAFNNNNNGFKLAFGQQEASPPQINNRSTSNFLLL